VPTNPLAPVTSTRIARPYGCQPCAARLATGANSGAGSASHANYPHRRHLSGSMTRGSPGPTSTRWCSVT
jgi:hypothetical protein